jgi:hypothetical protein
LDGSVFKNIEMEVSGSFPRLPLDERSFFCLYGSYSKRWSTINMATTKRRIHVSLPKDLEDVLVDLSVLMERPMASIVTELLVESLPALTHVADSLRSAKSGKLDVDGLVKTLEIGKSEIEQLQNDLNRAR